MVSVVDDDIATTGEDEEEEDEDDNVEVKVLPCGLGKDKDLDVVGNDPVAPLPKA